jgi:hypothetical protein
MPAIGRDLIGAGPGQVAAPVTGVPGPGADVVGIEEIGVVGMKDLIARAVLAQQKLLEEPGRMRAVPLRRARIRHRLDQLILRRERRGAPLGLVAHREIGVHQPLGERPGIGKQ